MKEKTHRSALRDAVTTAASVYFGLICLSLCLLTYLFSFVYELKEDNCDPSITDVLLRVKQLPLFRHEKSGFRVWMKIVVEHFPLMDPCIFKWSSVQRGGCKWKTPMCRARSSAPLICFFCCCSYFIPQKPVTWLQHWGCDCVCSKTTMDARGSSISVTKQHDNVSRFFKKSVLADRLH